MADIRDLFDDRIAAVGKIAAIDTATIVSILVRSGLCTADEFTRRRVAIAAEFDQLLAEKIDEQIASCTPAERMLMEMLTKAMEQ